MGQRRKFFFRNLIKTMNMAAALFTELRQPHVCALRDQHSVRHPRSVRAEFFVLICRIAKDRNLRLTDNRGPLLRSLLAASASSFRGGFPRAGSIGIELHPDS